MKPRISLITICVDDLVKSLCLCDGLGLAMQRIIDTEFEFGAVAFFDLEEGCNSPSGRARALQGMRGCRWKPPVRRS